MQLKSFIVLLGVALLSSCSSSPTDRVMEDMLRSNEAEFNQLVSMFKEDASLWEVNREFAKSSWDTKAILPSRRMEEYRRLLTRLNLIDVGRGERSGNTYLKAWHRGAFPFGGSTKFYVYAESQPDRIVDSIDRIERGGQDASVFMKVKDNWYLHLDVW